MLLPGPLLATVSILVLAFHLLAVNLGSGGPLVCVWLHRRSSRRGDMAAGELGRALAGWSLVALGAGMALGALSLGVLWLAGDDAYLAALRLFPAKRYWYGLAELAFSFILLLVYWRLWDKWTARTNWHALVALLAATNLLYHFPPLLGAVAAARNDAIWGRELAGGTTSLWLRHPQIGSLVLHVWLSSFAVAGAALMLLTLPLAQRETLAESAARWAVRGARIAVVPTLLQVLVGLWVMLSLPRAAQSALLGGDVVGTVLLAASIVAALGLAHYLAAVALGDAERRAIIRAVLLLGLVLALMTGALRRARLVPHSAAPRGAQQAAVVSYGAPPPRVSVRKTH